jgi:REP element-mobilizing transposase RayT
MFESRGDRRCFLAFVAREVRRGEVEVHAYSLLHTHFHMLARSPNGRLSGAMHRIQGAYSRRFNRLRRRDGPLVRRRFHSKTVDSGVYRAILVRYIDDNAVSARLVARARDYPYGSARHYASLRGPPWLGRGWVEGEVRELAGKDRYDPSDYEARFPSRLPDELREWIDAQIAGRSAGDGQLDMLVDMPPDRVMAWMHNKARNADGTEPWGIILPAKLLLAECELDRQREAPWPVRRSSGTLDGWLSALPGLLRLVCGLSLEEVSLLLRTPLSTARDRIVGHLQLLGTDAAYARRSGDLTSRALRRLGLEAGLRRSP